MFPFARSGERTRKKRRFVSDKPMVCVIRPMFHTLQEVLLMYVSRFHGLSTAWFWIECCERCTLHGCFTSPFEWRMRDVPFGTGSVRFWYILCTILPYCVKHVRVWKEGMFHNILLKINKMKDGESVKLSSCFSVPIKLKRECNQVDCITKSIWRHRSDGTVLTARFFSWDSIRQGGCHRFQLLPSLIFPRSISCKIIETSVIRTFQQLS